MPIAFCNGLDTMILSNDTLRYFHFTEAYNNSDYTLFDEGLEWIEGIGSNVGFFTFYGVFESGVSLACFHENDQNYVIDLFGAPSCETVGIVAPPINTDFQISPNPSSGQIKVSISNTNNQNTTASIHDIFGRLVKSYTIQTENSELNLSDLNDGVYFVKIASTSYANWQRVVLKRE